MELKIDTNKDSEEHIRQAIKLLHSLISDKEMFSNEVPIMQQTQESPTQNQDTGLMNMFDTSNSSSNTFEDQNTATQQSNIEASQNSSQSSSSQSMMQAQDQSGFDQYGNHEAVPSSQEIAREQVPQPKEEAPAGSLFGIFKEPTLKKRDDRITPY